MSKIKAQDVINFTGMSSITLSSQTVIEAGREIHLGVQQGQTIMGLSSSTFVVGGKQFILNITDDRVKALDIVVGSEATAILVHGESATSMYHVRDRDSSGQCIVTDDSWQAGYGSHPKTSLHLSSKSSIVMGDSNHVDIIVDDLVISGNVRGVPTLSIDIMALGCKKITSTEGIILEGSKIGGVEIGSSAPIKLLNAGTEGAQVVDHSGSYVLLGTHFPPQAGDTLVTLGDFATSFDCH